MVIERGDVLLRISDASRQLRLRPAEPGGDREHHGDQHSSDDSSHGNRPNQGVPTFRPAAPAHNVNAASAKSVKRGCWLVYCRAEIAPAASLSMSATAASRLASFLAT